MMSLTRWVVGIGVAGLALAGCGGDTSTETEGPGEVDYTTFSSHDEIVAAAEAEEGEFRAAVRMDAETTEHIADGFAAKYPFIDVTVTSQDRDENERTLLELEAGQFEFDLLHTGEDTYSRFLPFAEPYDLLAMAEAGTVDIPTGMINPDQPNSLSVGSAVGAIAWNRSLVPDEEVPQTYEDFLDPKWRGKFMTNIEGTNITALQQVWGVERTEKYITDLLANEPIWTDSDTAGLTAMVAGEFPLALGTNYHSAYRIQLEAPEVIGIAVLDPAPVRLGQIQVVREGTDRPAQGLLFLEYLASEEVQGWLDEFEPVQASIYLDGTFTEKLVKGKEIAAVDWSIMEQFSEMNARTQELWGFPVGQIGG